MGEKPHSRPLPHLGTSPTSSSAPRSHVALPVPRYHPGCALCSAPAVADSWLIQTGTFLTLVLDFPGRQGDKGRQERKVSKYKTQSVLKPRKSVKVRGTWLTRTIYKLRPDGNTRWSRTKFLFPTHPSPHSPSPEQRGTSQHPWLWLRPGSGFKLLLSTQTAPLR